MSDYIYGCVSIVPRHQYLPRLDAEGRLHVPQTVPFKNEHTKNETKCNNKNESKILMRSRCVNKDAVDVVVFNVPPTAKVI